MDGRVGSGGQLREGVMPGVASQVRHLAAWSVRKLGVPKQGAQGTRPSYATFWASLCLLEAPP